MRLQHLLLAVVILAACVPEYEQEPTPAAGTSEPGPAALPAREMVIPVPHARIFETANGKDVLWGYDENSRLILLNSSEKRVVFSYDNDGKLVGVDDGAMPVRFFYDNAGKLLSAEQGKKRWVFAYTTKGRLVGLNGAENLDMTYDSKGRLSSVAREHGPSTEFVYDELNRTESMFRSRIETTMKYDSEGRLTRMDREDDHLVIGYWRENLLSSLSGTMYGLKETVNYGPGAITLVSDTDQHEFASQYPDQERERLHAFNTFLFCTRFRKLPLLFDGQSWVLYHEYFRANISDYLLLTFTCDALPR